MRFKAKSVVLSHVGHFRLQKRHNNDGSKVCLLSLLTHWSWLRWSSGCCLWRFNACYFLPILPLITYVGLRATISPSSHNSISKGSCKGLDPGFVGCRWLKSMSLHSILPQWSSLYDPPLLIVNLDCILNHFLVLFTQLRTILVLLFKSIILLLYQCFVLAL